jgi:hypothetical protein
MTTAQEALKNISLRDIPSILPLLSVPEQEKLLAELEKLEELKSRKLSHNRFLAFVNAVWPTFISGRHHAKMADAFERVAEGKCKRLIINMPPRHTKSEFASYLLPAWFLGKYPHKKVIQTSHTAELAVVLGERYEILLIKTSIQKFFRGLGYKPTLKRLADGLQTRAETILLSVWGVLLRVKVRISSLLTTLTRNKKQP